MDLRQLQFVVAVADEGGFRPAARLLRTAQPPLSTAVRQLEIELGTALFERSTRGVVPTAAGRELVSRARRILLEVSTARDDLRRGDHRQKPVIRVAVLAGDLAAGELTLPLIDALRGRFEGATVELHETTFVDQVDALRAGDVDLAFIRPPVTSSDLAIVPVVEEPRCLVVGHRHPLAEAEYLDASDVLEVPMLRLSAPDEWATMWQLDDMRGRPLVSESVGPVRTVSGAHLALTASNAGITMTASTARCAPSPVTRSIPVRGLSPSVFALAYRRSDTRELTRTAIDAVAAAAAENIELLPDGVVLV